MGTLRRKDIEKFIDKMKAEMGLKIELINVIYKLSREGRVALRRRLDEIIKKEDRLTKQKGDQS